MKLIFKTPIDRPYDEVQKGFGQELFSALAPPLVSAKILRFDGCQTGDEIHLRLGPLGARWVSIITFEGTSESGWSFIDEGKVLPFPLKHWKHHHRVDKISPHKSLIVDDISFDCSPPFLGPIIKPILWAVFAIRPHRYKKFFEERP